MTRGRVESICRVLRETDCPLAARPHREWRPYSRLVAGRTVTIARVLDSVHEAASTTGTDGVRRFAPEGVDGRRKMSAHLRLTGSQFRSGGLGYAHPQADRGAPQQGRPHHGVGQDRFGAAATRSSGTSQGRRRNPVWVPTSPTLRRQPADVAKAETASMDRHIS